ncbi:MAG TPA: hypothetical protein VHN55_06530 [Sphingomicrobium sp.]|nr:hypothetical protein [Sphingomicrobium sp.]
MKRVRVAALLLSGVVLAIGTMSSAAFGQAVPIYAESAGDALARNVRTLAESPRDFNALVAAGKAALQLGDAQAAAGFFGRAEEINPNSPLPQVGMGAALVATGDPNGALRYFARAQQLGATPATIGCDRGLAYDLLGNQVAAQTDYRAALNGADRDEARRRLALSLAISGDKALATSTLQPLLQRRDLGAQRVRALVLALDGDVAGAKSALDLTMPGASARMGPFFRQLPALSSVQKAAAVHLGIFPENGLAVASISPGEDRLASVEQLLRSQPEQVAAIPTSYTLPAPAARQRPPLRTASIPDRRAVKAAASPNNNLIQTKKVAGDGGSRIWLQLASGDNAHALPGEFRKIRSRNPSLFTGLNGFVAQTDSRARLLIGPFHSQRDARLFSDALSSESIRSFTWTSHPGQVVRELPN